MKQDIRDLFRKYEVFNNKLPDTHKQEFYDKLKGFNSKTNKQLNYKNIYRLAATLLLFFAVGYFMLQGNLKNQSELVEQIETIEQEYLLNINKEWHNFLTIAKDEKLVKRYKKRLEDLNKDYQEISEQFKVDTNNILIVETLIENLNTRLQLLKDIQEHITLLNQENEYYENTTI